MAAPTQEPSNNINAHVSLPEDLIEKLKNVKNWEEWPCRWTFDEEKMSSPWLWPRCMVGDEKLHQLHIPNNEVVIGSKEIQNKEDKKNLRY